LIVDEAQGLSVEALEELRLLSNLQHDNRLLLQVFLVGQEPLLDMIRAPGMEQLHQRVIAASHLIPLQQDETRAYVEHRLHKVGWQNDPKFCDDSMNLIHKFSGGVPRRINLICHRLFLRGGLEQKHELAGADALHVIVELHKEGLLTPVVRRSLDK
jgi:general secretion pathway protein A